MKIVTEMSIYANPDPLLVSRQAIFPGIVQLGDGRLLAMFSMGQAFDSADQRTFVCTSEDLGRLWSTPRRINTHEFQPQISESLKPLLLNDGSLLAAGYGFVRPDEITPIVDLETFDVLPLKQIISKSFDNGQTWDAPRLVEIGGKPLELSGPCIQLSSGRIIGAAPPFHLGADEHSGWIIFSDDGGRCWDKLSTFFESPGGEVAAWECRLCETQPGHIAVLFWAYDNKKKRNLNNHIVFSSDGGQKFGPAVDTGVRAQASNLLRLAGDKILTIHAHRENPVGLWVRQVDIKAGGFSIEEELNLFADDAMGSDATDIRKQFGSLKFGQPSLLALSNGQVLAACWAFEDCQHVIKGFLVEF
jgi:sialidase-1